MVSVVKKKIKGKIYYYLEQSFRKGAQVFKKERYLGAILPKNIDYLKKGFQKEINAEFYPQFGLIKENYKKEERKTPKSAKEKNTKNFAIKFTYNTNRIEGSTITLKETAGIIEEGIAPRKPISDIKETESHNEVFYEMLSYDKDLSFIIVLYWHKKLFSKTKEDIAGKIREHQVLISQSKFTPPLAIELNVLLKEFFEWYNKYKNTVHPVELAALVHLKFVTLHPFSDGNGRISRLLMNFVLKKKGFPMIDIGYNKRNSYYAALEKSQVKKDETFFVIWFFKKYLTEYKNYR